MFMLDGICQKCLLHTRVRYLDGGKLCPSCMGEEYEKLKDLLADTEKELSHIKGKIEDLISTLDV